MFSVIFVFSYPIIPKFSLKISAALVFRVTYGLRCKFIYIIGGNKGVRPDKKGGGGGGFFGGEGENFFLKIQFYSQKNFFL